MGMLVSIRHGYQDNHSRDRGICVILTCRQQLQEKFSTVLLRNKSAMFQLLCIAKKFIGMYGERLKDV